MFEKELMFRWFVQLMSIPLQTVNNVDIQKDILEYIDSKCKYRYMFYKSEDNDLLNPSRLDIDFK